MMRTSLLVLIFLVVIPTWLLAQHMPGVSMGNFAGTQALYHNPAFVADSRYSVHINLVGAQLYLANNHIKYNAPYSFLSLMTNNVPAQYRNEKGAIILPQSDLEERLNGRQKHLNLGVDVRLPSFMISLKDGKYGIGFSTRVRTLLNMTEATEPIAQTLRSRGKELGIQKKLFENQSANLHLNGIGEYAITLGGVLLDDETDFFKVGITAKRLIGVFNTHILIEDGAYTIQPDPAYLDRKELYDIAAITTQYGYTSDGAFQNLRATPAWLVGNAAAGSGFGFDLGMVYEYRPNVHKYSYSDRGIRKRDGSKNKYLYRIAVSLTDVGRVKFKNPNYVSQYQVTTTNKVLRFQDYENIGGAEGLFTAVNQSLGVDNASRTTTFTSILPTALQASLDYQIKPNLYVNTLWVQNLIRPGAFGMKGESVLAVTPRYESRWYELSVPVSLMNRYGSFGIGIAGRVGPFWLGTDHLAGLLNIGKPKAINIYGGVSFGLFQKPPQSPNPCYLEDREPLLKRIFSGRRRR
jgi:hypothetical protein